MKILSSKFVLTVPEAKAPPAKVAPARAVLPKEPTLVEMAENFAHAVAAWSAIGFKTVSPEVYSERAAICDACQFWDGSARLGLGKCKAPKCGCSKLKRWLASEQCPLSPPKWRKTA